MDDSVYEVLTKPMLTHETGRTLEKLQIKKPSSYLDRHQKNSKRKKPSSYLDSTTTN